MRVFMQANVTGPAVPGDWSEFAFDPRAEGTPAMLAALEVDGEPAYHKLKCPGFLFVASVLLGVAGDLGVLKGHRHAALWRARCAFAWQKSLAEATDRGVGHAPSLFKIATADVAASLHAGGALPGDVLSAVQVCSFGLVYFACLKSFAPHNVSTLRHSLGSLVSLPHLLRAQNPLHDVYFRLASVSVDPPAALSRPQSRRRKKTEEER